MGGKTFLGLSLLLPLLCSSGAAAAEIHGRSSTQYLWYENELLTNKTSVELGEYLRVAITNIDKAGKFSIYGYGRGTQDFTSGQGLNGRLYYLYGDLRDLFDNRVDLRIGRQFVNLAAGSAIIDGVQGDLKNVGPVGFTVLGGHDVQYSLDGEYGDWSQTAFGVGAYLAGFRKTDAEISWFRKMDGGDVTRDVIGGSVKQYLFNSLKLYGNARFDLVSETFNETLGGIKFYPNSSLVLTGEYYQSYPTFDTTSFYSVFAVDRYQEMVLRADYAYSELLTLHAGYNREWFGEGGIANVYLAGLGVRPIPPLRLNVQFEDRTGYYGSTVGVVVDALYDLNGKLQAMAGFDWDAYRRDATGAETARKYWVGGKAKLARNLALSARVQDDVNVRFEGNWSGRVVLDYDF